MPKSTQLMHRNSGDKSSNWSPPKSDCDLNGCSAVAKSRERFGR